VLKSLDVLIGLTVIMLALSMAVTMVTQFVTSTINSRGKHLKGGLGTLINQLDPALDAKVADTIATAVLTHPLVSNARGGLGSVVHREEFTKLLLELSRDSSTLESSAKGLLKKALERNGIGDPEATLKHVRALTLDLETANPQLAADVRQSMAMVQGASSDLVAKVHNWFDQTMDRVSQRFTATTRGITFVSALVVAVGLQVDTVELVNRLNADDTLRNAFVQQAKTMQLANQNPDSTDLERDRLYRSFLAEKGLISLPSSGHWREHWKDVNFLGVLITSLLLSLGAPFWYNALSRLLQLRSVLAAKDDTERTARQTAPSKAAAAAAVPPAAPAAAPAVAGG
jgi:hypothetical protein